MNNTRLSRTLTGCAAALTLLTGASLLAEGDSTKNNVPPLLDPETDAPGLSVGDTAPEMKLPNAKGRMVDLAQMYREGPVVVTFYRGGWCPFCNRAMADWAGWEDDLLREGATLIAISPETEEHAIETLDKSGTGYLALVDPDGEAMRRYRVAFELDADTQDKYRGYGIDLDSWNASGRWVLPVPATYIIDTDGTVRWVFAEYDYKNRAKPSDVLAALKKITRGD